MVETPPQGDHFDCSTAVKKIRREDTVRPAGRARRFDRHTDLEQRNLCEITVGIIARPRCVCTHTRACVQCVRVCTCTCESKDNVNDLRSSNTVNRHRELASQERPRTAHHFPWPLQQSCHIGRSQKRRETPINLVPKPLHTSYIILCSFPCR
ncbi:hypothetical protein EVAR_16654_1 [Eumeta japonica]|uniref:Uncharacterized protein n=1 Tax=Eumeta variegata TaxID=151549 RepID=A0A4C1V067_EUMVA|nr:hypothetical protein EVAR_16654_1 [Eumeta japonica]